MALAKTALVNAIKQIQQNAMARTSDDPDAFANELANAIDAFVKSGTVTVNAGIPVATAGTAVSQTGATTSAGTGTIS